MNVYEKRNEGEGKEKKGGRTNFVDRILPKRKFYTKLKGSSLEQTGADVAGVKRCRSVRDSYRRMGNKRVLDF